MLIAAFVCITANKIHVISLEMNHATKRKIKLQTHAEPIRGVLIGFLTL